MASNTTDELQHSKREKGRETESNERDEEAERKRVIGGQWLEGRLWRERRGETKQHEGGGYWGMRSWNGWRSR